MLAAVFTELRYEDLGSTAGPVEQRDPQVLYLSTFVPGSSLPQFQRGLS